MTARWLVVLLMTAGYLVGSTSALFAIGSLTQTTRQQTTSNTRASSYSFHSNPFRYSPTPELLSNMNDNDENVDNEEETLLRLRLVVKEGISIDDALQKVQSYTQSFPYAVILPVQPMQYLPTLQGGVDVLFLRKKTPEKGSIDGGVHIDIFSSGEKVEIVVKRNSQGQTVPKVFSEKLLVQALVKAFSGEANERVPAAPTEFVTVKSVFHKWLDTNPVSGST